MVIIIRTNNFVKFFVFSNIYNHHAVTLFHVIPILEVFKHG